MTEQELLVDCLARLNGLAIPYMLTGSMASNYWGIPRTTHDIDFVIALRPADAERLVAVFAGDFFVQIDSVRAAFRPPHMFNALDERSALKVDFWVLRSEAFEQEMFSRRRAAKLFGVSAWLATAEDVILHKFVWHRISPSDRQLGDAAGIFAVQAEALDASYLDHWAARLGIVDLLADLRSGKLRPKST